MNAEYLNRILSNWSDSNSLPKVLYTIPNGSNPTGASMSLDRKKDIYSVNKWMNSNFHSFIYLDCSKI
jgi:kynurenine/2-aminoadipate aminotransferase